MARDEEFSRDMGALIDDAIKSGVSEVSIIAILELSKALILAELIEGEKCK